MSLLARLDRALLRRHQRACPWPTTSGAVTTIQPERPAMNDTRETVRRLRSETSALRVERDDLRVRLAERDAQVGRLTKRLSEGQG